MSVTFQSRREAAGFTLIEMMVAMVVGLIVIIAVIAFIVAVMRSNNQTIQATRLTQELRATMAVMAADLKRSRSVNDPLAAATSADAVYTNLASINTATAGCIQYGYQGISGNTFRTISVSDNKVLMGTGNVSSPACASGTQIGSSQVRITSLTFDNSINSRRIDIVLTGSLASPNSEMGNVTRTISETVYVRSKDK